MPGTSVLFENDRVRVWDMTIPPGQDMPAHTHTLPYFYVVVEPGTIRFGDDPWKPDDGDVGFTDIPAGLEKRDPRLLNEGSTTHREIVVELKPKPSGGYDHSKVAMGARRDGKTAPSNNVGTSLLFANDRVRVWDLRLAPGDQLAKHIHRVDNFFVMLSGGLIRFENPDDATDFRDVQFVDDLVTWVNVPPGGKIDNRLTNIGTKTHRNLLIELAR